MKRYKYNTFFLIIFCLFHLGMSFAQNTDFDAYRKQKQQEWNTYTNAKQKEYAEYRDKLNAAYAERMKTSWKPFQLSAAKPVPKQPEPPTPTVKPDNEKAPSQPLPVKEVVKPIVPEAPKPVKPIARPEQEEVPLYTFKYHNTTCNIHLQKNQAFSLSNVSEASAAAAWKQMSNNGFDIVADDCLKHKEQLALNDWGYIELTKALACSFLGKGNSEAVLMQAYLLVQSGYKIRLAKGNNRLVLMIPFSDELYGYSFMYLNGERYYLMSDDKRGGSYSVFTERFEGEKTPSLSIQAEPQFADNPTSPKTFASTRFPTVSASVSSNKNLIEFYNTYPITSHWNEYAKASLSKRVKRSLYPMLKKQIAGKTSLQAANILLNFVQTAFDYKTDQEQFGYERPLFGDEIFYYPYSDCEDRSILFSILVRDLLKLDVVMLFYPGHLATAVHFTEEVSGYYFMVKNKKYIVCDPTYIGAPVGDCMPQFVGTSATIIEI
ncbi:MAG: hypothetical protein J5606_08395 [Bacteroidales bacterium]|nr:hypothetical protein [Bacteroidales bacterium]